MIEEYKTFALEFNYIPSIGSAQFSFSKEELMGIVEKIYISFINAGVPLRKITADGAGFCLPKSDS